MFLQLLIERLGPSAVDSWLSPLHQPHDFRLHSREFEVKTTVSPRRIHTIRGAEQLAPSEGCSLYLVSVLLAPPGVGPGFSLGDKVAEVVRTLSGVPTRQARFTAAVEARGFRESDNAHYSRRFTGRRPMGLVEVNESFPVISRRTIQLALGRLATRVESLRYDVNVDGLEQEEGSAAFESVLQG